MSNITQGDEILIIVGTILGIGILFYIIMGLMAHTKMKSKRKHKKKK